MKFSKQCNIMIDDRMKVMSMELIWEIWIMWFAERRDKVTGRKNGAVYICKKKKDK